MDLVEFHDVVNAVFETVDVFRGIFFFSKSAGGGGAGHEMIDSNTSLPSIY